MFIALNGKNVPCPRSMGVFLLLSGSSGEERPQPFPCHGDSSLERPSLLGRGGGSPRH